MMTLVASVDGAGFAGRWFRLCYSQSLAGQPVRPLVRFIRTAKSEEHLLCAAVLGRTGWTWRAPRDLERLEILISDEAAGAFRVDRIVPISTPALLIGLLRRRPRSLLPFILPDTDRGRNVAAHEAFDLAAPDEFDRALHERRRPLEPAGLDAPLLADAASGPLLGFVVAVATIDDVAALRRTVAAFTRQHDRGFRLRIEGPAELLADLDRNGLGDKVEFTTLSAMPPDVEFAARIIPGDEPLEEAVLCLRAELARHPTLDMLYSDSAERNARGRLVAQLKPDWSPTFRQGRDYIGRPRLVRTKPWNPPVPRAEDHDADGSALDPSLEGRAESTPTGPAFGRPDDKLRVEPGWGMPGRSVAPPRSAGADSPSPAGRDQVGDPRKGPQDEEGWDLRIEPSTQAIGHLKRVLFTLTAPPAHQAGAPARSDPQPATPHASLVVPTRDRVELLRTLCKSLGRTSGSYDLVVIDNGSEDPAALAYLDTLASRPDVRVLRRPGPFNFSALVNAGAEAARGPILVFLNNDCEIIEDDWLTRLASAAAKPDIGAVGAKLLYANGTLQHAGVGLGLGGKAGHRDRKMPHDHPGNLGRLLVPHEVAAVTAACLAVRRDVFREAGGFDENLPVAFNDIDFCLRLLRAGYRNILEPGAVVRHAESASRGRDDGPRRERFLREAARFRDRWHDLIRDDPYTHPMLSTFRFYDRLG